MMAARVLGPILITRFMRRKKTKRSSAEEQKQNTQTDTHGDETFKE